MEYQVSVNYSIFADSDEEAKKKAKRYVSNNLKVKPMLESVLSPFEVARKCEDFRTAEKEHFCVFFLDTQNSITGREIVSVGTLNTALIHPRECFKAAIRRNCCSVIFVHNHPSGSLIPSAEDIATTKRLSDAGKLLGIEVLDHVIVTSESYKSLKEERLI